MRTIKQLRPEVNETTGLPLFDRDVILEIMKAAPIANPCGLIISEPKVRDSVEAPRLSKQCMIILGRLMVGPVTNTELVKLAQRFGARLHDLRQAGYDIEIESRDRETGVVWYRLKGQTT